MYLEKVIFCGNSTTLRFCFKLLESFVYAKLLFKAQNIVDRVIFVCYISIEFLEFGIEHTTKLTYIFKRSLALFFMNIVLRWCKYLCLVKCWLVMMINLAAHENRFCTCSSGPAQWGFAVRLVHIFMHVSFLDIKIERNAEVLRLFSFWRRCLTLVVELLIHFNVETHLKW